MSGSIDRGAVLRIHEGCRYLVTIVPLQPLRPPGLTARERECLEVIQSCQSGNS